MEQEPEDRSCYRSFRDVLRQELQSDNQTEFNVLGFIHHTHPVTRWPQFPCYSPIDMLPAAKSKTFIEFLTPVY
jgi:hypothetical protein